MDQESRPLAWWTEVVFRDWRSRPGPRYARLAAAILAAIDRKILQEGGKVPAERALAAAVGVSRGTVVACFDQLVAAGVLARRQGDGTYIAGHPSWTATATSMTAALLRRMAADRETIDLSAAGPADLSHLPTAIQNVNFPSFPSHGLDPVGLPHLRAAVARHLTRYQGLPSSPDQIVITNGAQEALWLLTRVLPAGAIVTSCPTYPGLTSVVGGSRAAIVVVPADGAGPDPAAVERAGRSPHSVAFVMPAGHNPVGGVMPLLRRQTLASLADAGRVTVIEDLALADLALGEPGEPGTAATTDAGGLVPLSALSPKVIAVGSASKLLWGGLRIGWLRVADEALRGALVGRKAALNLATSVISQEMTAQLLEGITPGWLAAHRLALASRRDYLLALIGEHLPAWRVRPPQAGLSLWAQLPLTTADPFAHAAARHGVTLTPGSAACVCGTHGNHVRLSFAERPGPLELAAERLAAAWASHAADLAATPLQPAHPDPFAPAVQ
jgi:DNA-binding transcriptional MocR family regulator